VSASVNQPIQNSLIMRSPSPSENLMQQ